MPTTRIYLLVSLSAFLLLFVVPGSALAQGSAFLYQGRLTDSGSPANGTYDIQFKLFDTPGAGTGTQQGVTITNPLVSVSAGIFAVTLDFTASVFTGSARYLEIGVRPAGSGIAYTVLAPRQSIASAPYSIQTINAAQLGGLPANRFLATDATGNVGIGTSIPTSKLDVRGSLTLEAGDSPGLYTGTGNVELNRYLAVLNSPGFLSASGLKAGGVLVSNDYFFANPGKNDLVVKGSIGLGTATGSNVKLFIEAGSEASILAHNGNNFGVYSISDGGIPLVVKGNNSSFLVSGFDSEREAFHILRDGTFVAGSDFAESMPASGEKSGYEPGDILVASAKAPGRVEKASRPYDPRVAGVYSTRPGVLGANKNGTTRIDSEDVPVAIAGIVPTKVSTRNGAIRVGDLLTTSSVPGYAMRCTNRSRCFGAVVGKALEPLANGKSVIKVLVMLR